MNQLIFNLDFPENKEMVQTNPLSHDLAKSIKKPNRYQVEFKIGAIDDLIPYDHKARIVWDYVQQLDLSSFYNKIKLPAGIGGPRTTDPKILLCIWLFALLEGNYSARFIAKLTKCHYAYIWICGGVSVNYHTLSDFRSKNSENLRLLFQESIAILWTTGRFNPITGVAQDGTRVKASASNNSSRRGPRLQLLLEEAEKYLKTLENEQKLNSNSSSFRQKAANERAALERKSTLEKAVQELKDYKENRKASGKKNNKNLTEKELNETRVSITDPECRKMKMGQGGYRNAFNVQFAASIDKQVIVGVSVVNTLDPGTVGSMIEQVEKTLSFIGCSMPLKWLADSAYANKYDSEIVEKYFPNITFYSPPTGNQNCDALTVRKSDNTAMKNLRQRMSTTEAQIIYKDRMKTIEFANAVTKNRGMGDILVRGIEKVTNMALLYAVCHNMMVFFRN